MEPNRTHPNYDWLIGSSELGSCLIAQAAARIGTFEPLPTSEKMQALYDRGHEHEIECLAAMKDQGKVLTGFQDEYILDCGNRVGVIIHVDAIGSLEPRSQVVEIKSPTTWESLERAFRTATFTDPYMDRCAWQISCQMIATGMEAVVASYHEEKGLRTFVVEVAPYSETEIRARVAKLVALVELGMLTHCYGKDYPCRWRHVIQHGDIEELDSDPQMDGLLLAYAEAADAEKAAKARKDQYRAEVEALLTGETYRSDVGKATRVSSTRRTLDAKLLEAAGIDPESYMKETLVTSLRITCEGAGLSPGGALATDTQGEWMP